LKSKSSPTSHQSSYTYEGRRPFPKKACWITTKHHHKDYLS
jgi:hypothetical protein